MNNLEKQMVEVLKRMKGENGLFAVKAEFEAEGTRTEELMRLKEIALAADVDLVLKIGGCDAVRDMHDARSFGVQHMVAPMVESRFALQKYLKAVEQNFPPDEREGIGFLVNIETINTIEVFDELFDLPEIGLLTGIVLGRGDLVESMGKPRTAVDEPEILALATEVLVKAKARGFVTVMGGGININSIHFLRALPEGCLDRFETRKACFNTREALNSNVETAIENALKFEFHWLESKHEFYKRISNEDDKRIGVLRKRFVSNS